jgi:hypothetical protein
LRSSSGTVRAGLDSFIKVFNDNTGLREKLKITDEEIKNLSDCSNLMRRIYDDSSNFIAECED